LRRVGQRRRRETATGSTRPPSILAGCPASHKEAEFEADLDEVSRILSSRFASPEAIVIAMDCCHVRVSERLVDKIQHRFSSDWVAAFRFFMYNFDVQTFLENLFSEIVVRPPPTVTVGTGDVAGAAQ
jgi:hypothetical protein